MHIEQYVTEWGFPALAWRDRINGAEMSRRLWINFDGEQVVTLYQGKESGVGCWYQWNGLSVGLTTRDHATLTASFIDGAAKAMPIAVGPRPDMEELGQAIHRTFLLARANYKAPADGACWTRHFTGTHVPLEPGEQSTTRVDVSERECEFLKFKSEFPVPSIAWREPVRTGGAPGAGTRYHLVQRILFVGRGVRKGHRHLSFHSYKPGTEGVVEVHADFAFLKGFRIVDSRETNALELQPLKGTMPGISIVADFPLRAHPAPHLRLCADQRGAPEHRALHRAIARQLHAAGRKMPDGRATRLSTEGLNPASTSLAW
jgi:hypothetical protein